METLTPRALYDDDELGITRRLPWISGILFGSGIGLFTLIERLGGGGSVAGAFGYALVAAVLGGAGYGLLFPWLLTRLARPVNDRIYAGDPRLVPPPPPGYLYRLPCGYLAKPNLSVGGVLYLGPGGLRFDPPADSRPLSRTRSHSTAPGRPTRPGRLAAAAVAGATNRRPPDRAANPDTLGRRRGPVRHPRRGRRIRDAAAQSRGAEGEAAIHRVIESSPSCRT